MQAINIGLLGLGTVGGGVAEVLRDNQAEIARRLGRQINITAVCDLNAERAAQLCPQAEWVANPIDLVQRADVDIVVELFGGTGIAKEAVLNAINSGKHVVTANKKLLAEYGNEIFALAEQKNVMVQFEAAVAGGIPVIKALREGLAANRIQSIAGIINGTSNFILSEMREKGSAFKDTPVNFGACYLEGISRLDSRDIKYAEELGYRVKLLGITRKTDKGIELRVHPTLIPECRLLANVNGVMNAVRVQADMVGETLYYGAGAGALPTASAVVADLIDISRLITADTENRVPHLAFQPSQVQAQNFVGMDDITSSYYLRVQVTDKAGVLGTIANLLAKEGVSIEALIQKAVLDNNQAEIVILTHSTVERNVKTALRAIEALDSVGAPVTLIRMESLNG